MTTSEDREALGFFFGNGQYPAPDKSLEDLIKAVPREAAAERTEREAAEWQERMDRMALHAAQPDDHGAATAVAKAKTEAEYAARAAAREAAKAAAEAGASAEAAAEAGRKAAAEVLAAAQAKAAEYAAAHPTAPPAPAGEATGGTGDMFADTDAAAQAAADAPDAAGQELPELPDGWLQQAADARDHEQALQADYGDLPASVQPLVKAMIAARVRPDDQMDLLRGAADVIARATVGVLTRADLDAASAINNQLTALGLPEFFEQS